MASSDPKANQAHESAVRAQLTRILKSRLFSKALRLSRFLTYITEETVEGKGDGLKESRIGFDVFDRRPSTYDPGADPIVRVQASRLRARLAQYYEGEGAEDPLIIEIPLGGYVPRFRTRTIAAATQRPTGEPSVVVLPFVNMSSSAENEYFSDGLTEELTHSLVRLGSLQVAARTSAFQFKGRARDVREIGRQLGMSHVLEGSVRQFGDRLRITVQLVNVENGCQLWSERYDRISADIFEIQDEIAAAIRNALTDQLPRRTPASAPNRPTRNIEAFNQYLQGRFQWNKRTEAGFQAALGHFEEAIRHDPEYARAHAGLADCYIMLGLSGATAPNSCMPLAEQAATEALSKDNRLAEAHNSRGAVMAVFHWNREGAEREFRQALALDPDYATLHHWRSLFHFAAQGQTEDAVAEMQKAVRLDPISLPIQADLALVHLFCDDFAHVVEQCARVIALDANYYRAYWYLGLAWGSHGDFSAAMNALEKALALCPGGAFRQRIRSAMGFVLARWGRRPRAEELRGELEATGQGYIDRFDIAQIDVGLDETRRALEQLELGLREKSCFLIFAKNWPTFRGIQGEVRFQRLLTHLSLPPQ